MKRTERRHEGVFIEDVDVYSAPLSAAEADELTRKLERAAEPFSTLAVQIRAYARRLAEHYSIAYREDVHLLDLRGSPLPYTGGDRAQQVRDMQSVLASLLCVERGDGDRLRHAFIAGQQWAVMSARAADVAAREGKKAKRGQSAGGHSAAGADPRCAGINAQRWREAFERIRPSCISDARAIARVAAECPRFLRPDGSKSAPVNPRTVRRNLIAQGVINGDASG